MASDSSDEVSIDNKELALIAKRFKKFLKTKKGKGRNKFSKFIENPRVTPMELSKERRTRARKIRTLNAFNIMSVRFLAYPSWVSEL